AALSADGQILGVATGRLLHRDLVVIEFKDDSHQHSYGTIAIPRLGSPGHGNTEVKGDLKGAPAQDEVRRHRQRGAPRPVRIHLEACKAEATFPSELSEHGSLRPQRDCVRGVATGASAEERAHREPPVTDAESQST